MYYASLTVNNQHLHMRMHIKTTPRNSFYIFEGIHPRCVCKHKTRCRW